MIVITGSDGFIGKHFKIFCKINKIKNVIFVNKKNFKKKIIINKIRNCTYFIHLAGINRKTQGNLITKNKSILNYYLEHLKFNNKLKNLVYTSSVRRNQKSDYGVSKKLCEKLIRNFSRKRSLNYKILVLPNLFGEFCNPNYNSVVATFSYNLINKKKCQLLENKKIKLLYIQDAVREIYYCIRKSKINKIKTTLIKTFDLYNKLKKYNDDFLKNIIPRFKNKFEFNLYNTFKSYTFPKYIISQLQIKKDHRGSLWEVIKSNNKAHIFVSTSLKNQVRGNHYHTNKIEKFICLKGNAEIKIRRIFEKKIYRFFLNDKKYSSMDIPTFCTHSLRNKTNKELLMMFYSNEIYNPKKSDTYHEQV